MSEPIPYAPTEGISYSPSESIYWDHDALSGEIDRTFEICHGCRMCFKYCDSFPLLFSFIDERHDGDVRKISEIETEQVMDACFQCKLCEVQCPYTVRENHEFLLDFPKLVHRYKAQKTAKHGVSFRNKMLGDPEKTAKLVRSTFGIADKLNQKSRMHRKFMEFLVGIHNEKNLPKFPRETFTSWAEKENLISGESEGEVVLFPTCYVENNEPEIGQDTVKVLKKNGISVTCEKGLACCGMPAWESGDLETMQDFASKNLDLLEPHVKAGKKVVAINPTCSMMLRQEYPELVKEEDKERALLLAEKIADPSEYLWSIRNEERFNTDFATTPQKVSYHTPCHLRAQSIGFKARDLLRKIPGVKVDTTMECCGHDGTFAMKTESFEASVRIGKKSFDSMSESSAEIWATDCPLAAMQFDQHADRRPMHPMSILAQAYDETGFSTSVDQIQETDSKNE
ncbi:MAG: heterodisulfide reductase-related iron-sulfur binding cluster [Actinomycetota bacterium]|nr:heterodisulfide reductase-related iron-sulfur binding cluster [Actinomycetota bacterium]